MRVVPPQNALSLKPLALRERGWGEGIVALAFILVVGLNTWADYTAWAARADLFYDSDGDMQAAGQWLEQNAAPDDLVYVYSRFYEHPTLLAHDVDHGQVRWVLQDQRFTPPPGQRAITIYPQSLIDDDKRAELDSRPDKIDGPPAPDGRPAFVAALTPAAESEPVCDSAVSFGGILQPCGASRLTSRSSGQLRGQFTWLVLRTPARPDLTPVIRVVDAWGDEVAPRQYPYFDQSNRWLPGETITVSFAAQLALSNPPGSYSAEVSWISRDDPAAFLPILDPGGAYAGIWQRELLAFLSAAELPQSPQGNLDGLEPILPDLYVLEAPALPERAEQGERLHFSMRWYAGEAPGDVSPLSLVAVPAAGGAPVRLWQGDPAHDTFPMREWVRFQSLIDRYDVPIPPDIPPGRYTLRLEVPGGERPAFAHEIDIIAVERSFDAPPDLQASEYRLGPGAQMFQLAGYAAALDGDALSLRLAWRALTAPDRDYTVFVHVLNPDGVIFSQVDRQPAPATSRWLAGQVVTESYSMTIPEGPYSIEIGLYVQENGQRLAVYDERGASVGDSIRLDAPPRTAGDAHP